MEPPSPGDGFDPTAPGDQKVVLDEKVVLGESLGTGRSSVVFAGTHLTLDVPVAVKILKPEFLGDESSYELLRFRADAHLGALLRDPACVRVFDHEQRDGLAYTVCERVFGITLADAIQREPLNLETSLAVVRGVLNGLERTLELGLELHGDLNPGKLFVTESGKIKLSGFGLGRLRDEDPDPRPWEARLALEAPGAARYLAPDLVRSPQTADHRADLYVCGLLLCECLSGQPPLDGERAGDVLERAEEVLAQAELPAIPRGVRELLQTLLAPDPSRRPNDPASALALVNPLLRAAKPSGLLRGLKRLFSSE